MPLQSQPVNGLAGSSSYAGRSLSRRPGFQRIRQEPYPTEGARRGKTMDVAGPSLRLEGAFHSTVARKTRAAPKVSTPDRRKSVAGVSSPAWQSSPVQPKPVSPPAPSQLAGIALAIGAGDDLECHSPGSPAKTIDARASAMGSAVRELELLAEGFKNKVSRVAVEFEALRDALDDYALRYDGLQTDHSMALAALEEEKCTVETYYAALRNAEVEVKILKTLVPDDQLEYELAFSQARP